MAAHEVVASVIPSELLSEVLLPSLLNLYEPIIYKLITRQLICTEICRTMQSCVHLAFSTRGWADPVRDSFYTSFSPNFLGIQHFVSEQYL